MTHPPPQSEQSSATPITDAVREVIEVFSQELFAPGSVVFYADSRKNRSLKQAMADTLFETFLARISQDEIDDPATIETVLTTRGQHHSLGPKGVFIGILDQFFTCELSKVLREKGLESTGTVHKTGVATLLAIHEQANKVYPLTPGNVPSPAP